MGVMLYKEGDKHTVRGVKCEFVVVKNRSLKGYLALGWKTRVEDLYQDEPQAPPVATPKPDLQKFSATPPSTTAPPRRTKAESEAIRQEARAAGIEGWDRRQIGKLKLELGYT